LTPPRHFPPRAQGPNTSSLSGRPESAYDQACISERNCGRWETRYIETIPVTAENSDFPFAAQAGRISKHVEQPSGEISHNSYVLVTSVEQARMNAVEMLKCRRRYWGVESGLHHPLDVTALEDKSRVRLRNNVEVLALMRRASVSISNAWKAHERNPRQANLPGFFEATRLKAVGLLTKSARYCAGFIARRVE
jgi:hypothetical protein